LGRPLSLYNVWIKILFERLRNDGGYNMYYLRRNCVIHIYSLVCDAIHDDAETSGNDEVSMNFLELGFWNLVSGP